MNTRVFKSTLECVGAVLVLATSLVACSGEDGASGLIRTDDEPAGVNCVDGGLAVSTGLDKNGDGVLDVDEVISVDYLCGSNGSQTLVKTSDESAGSNCAEGGVRVDFGIDDNQNAALDDDEIDGTSYVCDSANGQDTLVSLSAEPPGANCFGGGVLIEAGLDIDGDAVLDANEVSTSEYVCDALTFSTFDSVLQFPSPDGTITAWDSGSLTGLGITGTNVGQASGSASGNADAPLVSPFTAIPNDSTELVLDFATPIIAAGVSCTDADFGFDSDVVVTLEGQSASGTTIVSHSGTIAPANSLAEENANAIFVGWTTSAPLSKLKITLAQNNLTLCDGLVFRASP